MTFGSLFAGIGGMDLGLERAGMQCRWQVEIDPFCQKVLAKHWPNVPKYGDIRELTGQELEPVDLIAGGFPCQDISIGGRRVGIEGSRSGLFFEILRLSCHLRPNNILLENVSALLDNGMGRVLAALAEGGYDAEWDCFPACAFGAPHRRDRVFILAYPKRKRLPRPVFAGSLRLIEKQTPAEFGNRIIACGSWWYENRNRLRVEYGVPRSVAGKWVKAYGNAVVPQVAEWIGRRIIEANYDLP